MSAANGLILAKMTCDTVATRKPEINPKMKWEYEDGVVLEGFFQLYKQTADKQYLDYVKYNLDLFIDGTGNIPKYSLSEFNIDHINNGKVLLDLYEETKDERYKKAVDLLRSQLDQHPRTSEGSFWHKYIYPYQVWLDGLYMGSVFYAKYAYFFGEIEDLDDVLQQFVLCEKNLRDQESGLLYHAWDEKKVQPWCDKDTGLSPNFWGRSMGWFVMALVDVIEYFPQNHPGRETLIQIYNRAISALLAVQDEKTGLWYQVLDQGEKLGNYLESSASSMIVYAIQKGRRLGYLHTDGQYDRTQFVYSKLVESFITITKENLVNVNKICYVGGLGGVDQRDGSFAYYISEPIVANDHKGVGPFILASVEMARVGIDSEAQTIQLM